MEGLLPLPSRGTVENSLLCLVGCALLTSGCGLFLERYPDPDDAGVDDDAPMDAFAMDAPRMDAARMDAARDVSEETDAAVIVDAFALPDAFVLPDAFAFPDAFGPEVCNGIDDDRDGDIDEGGVCRAGGVECIPESFGGRTYLRCDANVSWDDARVACILMLSNLVIIETAEENLFVQSQASMLDWTRPGRELWGAPRLWIGLRNRATILDPTNEWRWGNGGTLDFFEFWNPGEPNGGVVEVCGEMRGWGSAPFTYAWNDSLCAGTRAFLCERVP